MPMQKIEFTFPDENDESAEIEVENSSMTSPFEEENQQPPEPEAKAEPKPEPEAKVADNELDIEVVDDTPQEDRNRVPGDPPEEVTDEELEEYSDKVQKRIKKFTRGYHDERRAKEAAQRERDELERYARQIMEENNRLKGTIGQNQQAMFEQAKSAVSKDLENAKTAYRQAHESGDSEALLSAQENLNRAQYRQEQLNAINARAGQQKPDDVQREVQQAVPQQPQQPQRKPDERAQQWANENTWFGQDQEMTALALGTHAKLVESGIDPTSDEYYERLNSRMHQVFPEQFGDAEPPKGEPRAKQSVVAPATRSTAPKKVKLTQTQVALAKRLGISLEDYAKQVAIEMRKANG